MFDSYHTTAPKDHISADGPQGSPSQDSGLRKDFGEIL
jgi:hypothetical protein